MTSAWHCCVGGCAAAIIAACSGTPPTRPSAPAAPNVDTSDSNRPLRLSTERFQVHITAIDGEFRPSFFAFCEPLQLPPAGKLVTSYVWFEQDGEGFIGRTRPPYRSTLEIRLRRTSSSPAGVLVDGTIAGFAEDEYDRFLGKRDTAVRTDPGPPVPVTGRVPPFNSNAVGEALSGRILGPVTFYDSRGDSSRCTEVSFFMQVLPFGGPDDDPTQPPIAPGVRGR
jgi:hypothetical protein